MIHEVWDNKTLASSLNMYLLLCDDDNGENFDLIVEAQTVDAAMQLWTVWMRDDVDYYDESLPSIRRVWQLTSVQGPGTARALKWDTDDMVKVYEAEV